MKAKQQKVNRQTSAVSGDTPEAIIDAHNKLAEGVCAMLALESTEAYLANELMILADTIFNRTMAKDRISVARQHLVGAGEWKARQV